MNDSPGSQIGDGFFSKTKALSRGEFRRGVRDGLFDPSKQKKNPRIPQQERFQLGVGNCGKKFVKNSQVLQEADYFQG